MRFVAHMVGLAVVCGAGCAGCGPLDGEGDNARLEGGGIPSDWDVSTVPDGAGVFDRSDAGGQTAEVDLGTDVAVAEDLAEVDVSPDQGVELDLGPVGPVCGDGIVEAPEICDDGVTQDCVGTHDGGDGTCVAAGSCSAGYVFDGTGCVPEQVTQHVHIYVANDCSMMVDPVEFVVPRNQTVRFQWHNHSQFYAVDVWQSYIGGFTDLAPGMTWSEQFEWCFNVNPYTGYSDITTNEVCPSHRFFITCNGRD